MDQSGYLNWLDYTVLGGYFLLMIGIGVFASLRIKRQEDFFMGGRSFGKVLQTFAAFGAGTGSSDPVNTGRTTYTSGMSGMWSVMYWLFVTPFYWITAVWYRRMRHLTLGDWFTERYQSKSLGLGYAIFGIIFYMVYGSMLFSAIGKVAAPMLQADTVTIFGMTMGIEYLLVPLIGVVVLAYGIAGGLEAAYFTDVVQGSCIILLSIILIPYGLDALVDKFGAGGPQTMLEGFRILHDRLPPERFHVIGSSSSEFPLFRIVAIVIINLVGIVVQPHFIATGGGSAKSEWEARVGLVTGNFLKRFCTIGWVLTALIALALYADLPELIEDPDRTWGVASRELLTPGLRGLMLACLLAALMSSVDAYMVVGSGLVVRNIYAAYIDPHASERHYVWAARLTGGLIVCGAVIVSLFMMDVFAQLQLTWVFGVTFAAPFWIGMHWRGATKAAAWACVAYCVLVFFLIPFLLPMAMPSLRTDARFLQTNRIYETTTTRRAAPTDVERRRSEIETWEQKRQAIEDIDGREARREALASLGDRPEPLELGESITDVSRTGGKSIYWTNVTPLDKDAKPKPVEGSQEQIDENTTRIELAYDEDVAFRGEGDFQVDFLFYRLLGWDLRSWSNAGLDTLQLPVKIITPFLVMILLSFVTPRCRKPPLDRYYIKMKTPVHPNHKEDLKRLEHAYSHPEKAEEKKLFPGTSLEFSRPTRTDVVGFVISFLICFGIIGLAMFAARIGS